MKKQILQKLISVVSLAAMAFSLVATSIPVHTVYASDAPYKTYTYDGYGNMSETQTAYLPYETIAKFSDEQLKNPSDMFLSKDGLIYVADTGNSRIVIGDINGNLVKIIGEGVLKTPKGIYVTEDGTIYVADRDANAVILFDQAGNEITRYTKPQSPLYGNAISYQPIKITVNQAGVMYVVCESNTNGIVEISPTDGGTFLGYFGTNFARVTLQTIIYRAILTDAQRAKMVSNAPATPDNLCIDHKGLIYTVTRGDKATSLKHLNIAGNNIIEPEVYCEIPAAVTAGNHDNVYVVSQQGYIYEYNDEGEILFVFGASDDGTQRVGLCSLVSAIQVDSSDRIYILDTDKAHIQIYEPTEFTKLLHTALNLYATGKYTESKEPLTEVLKMNALFDYANKAMGRAYFQEENYEMAKYYSKLAKDKHGYSDASWEIRNIWLKNYVVPVILVIVAIWAVTKILGFLDKKKGILNPCRALGNKLGQVKFIKNTGFAFGFMKHPVDKSYGIAREKKASLLTANILLLVFLSEYIINKYLCGFLQKTVREGQYNIFQDIAMILILIIGVTLCNYLVCTINDGEGTVKKIYCTFIYSLTPAICLIPVSFLLSHIVTSNEQFLMTFTKLIIYVWCAVLMVIGMKEVNNFSAKETAKVIFLTVFTALIMALLIFIVYVLWAQVFSFIGAIVGEVVYRIGS